MIDIEIFFRIGDHAENIIELAVEKIENDLEFSEEAIEDLRDMFAKCRKAFKNSIVAFETNSESLAREVLEIEVKVNELEKRTREGHIDRLNKRQCLTEAGVIFLDTVSNLERISDHCSNVAYYVLDQYK